MLASAKLGVPKLGGMFVMFLTSAPDHASYVRHPVLLNDHKYGTGEPANSAVDVADGAAI